MCLRGRRTGSFWRQTSNTKKMNVSNWNCSLKPTKPKKTYVRKYVRTLPIHDLSLKVTEPKERNQWIIDLLVLMIEQKRDKTDRVMRLISDHRLDTRRLPALHGKSTGKGSFIYLQDLSHKTTRFLRHLSCEDGDVEETVCGGQTCVLWGQLCWRSWEDQEAAQNHPGPCKRVSDVSEPCFFLGYRCHILWFDLIT